MRNLFIALFLFFNLYGQLLFASQSFENAISKLEWMSFRNAVYFVNDPLSIRILKMGSERPPQRVSFIYQSRDEDWNSFVNETLVRLLNTKTGSQICSSSTYGETALIRLLFGVDSNFVSKVKLSCSSWSTLFSRPNLPTHFRGFGKEWVLYVTDDQPTPVWSWTDKGNMTRMFINLDLGQQMEVEVVRSIAHEIVMIADSMTNPLTNEKIGATIKNISLSNRPDLACDVVHALDNPTIIMGANIYRATRLENKILEEAGYIQPSNQAEDSRASCSEKLYDSIQIAQQLINSGIGNIGNGQTTFGRCGLGPSNPDIATQLQILEEQALINDSISLCSALLRSDFNRSTATFGKDTDPGPRPNTGAGTGGPSPKTNINILLTNKNNASLKNSNPSLFNEPTQNNGSIFDQVKKNSNSNQPKSTLDIQRIDLPKR